jgi:CRISPR-associated exonuclease Cas4
MGTIDRNTGSPPSPPADVPRQPLDVTGTEIHYAVICPRKLWWFSHGIEQEHSGGASASAGQENVALGQQLHQDRYPGVAHKETMIDGLLRIDFTDDGVVHEVKKSRGGLKATRMQILYYLYYLKHEKGIETTGMIDFPKERKREPITLTMAAERDVERTIADVHRIKALPAPPTVADPMPICRSCSYEDLCWG